MQYRLDELFELQMGKTPSRDNPQYWANGDNKWIAISDFPSNSKYISSTKEAISDLAISETGIKNIPSRTVVMSFKLSIGKVGITTGEIFSNEAIMAFIDKKKEKIIPEYLFYYLNSRNWNDYGNKAVMGLTLNKRTLSTMKVNLHYFDEQESIVANLQAVEALISDCNSQLLLLDTAIKSRFVEMFGDPVSNPKGWGKKALSEEAEIKIGPFGSFLHKEDYGIGGHALINPSHIVNGKLAPDNKLTISNEKYDELSAYHLKRGDVILGRRGEMGRCAVVDQSGLLCGTGSMIIRTNGDLSADFIQTIISFPTFKRLIEDMAVGQTMPNLNVPIVSEFQIIKPPKSAQDQYYAFIAEIDKLKAVIQKTLNEAQLLFDSLMQEYFG